MAINRLSHASRPDRFTKHTRPVEMLVHLCIHNYCRKHGCAVTPSIICGEVGLSKSALTAVLNSLEEQKLIERTPSKEDRRVVLITETEYSHTIGSSHFARMKSTMSEFLDELGEEDAEKFIDMLTRAAEVIQKNKNNNKETE